MSRRTTKGPDFRSIDIAQEVRRAHPSTIIVKAEGRVGLRGFRTRTLLIGRPTEGKISSSPAYIIAGQIRRALRPPDPMPELRRRLRELRGEA